MTSAVPKVSVILSVFNNERYLSQCLDSVCGQSLRDIEIICVDGGSTDGTVPILDEYAGKDSRVKVICKDGAGYGEGMNIGIGAASGEYIGIVEGDDFIDIRMYEQLFAAASNHPEADIIKSTYWKYYGGDGSKEVKKFVRFKNTKPGVFNIHERPELLTDHPSIWSAIYHRSFLEGKKIRFVEAPGAGWVDNPFFFEALCLAGKIVWIPDAFYYYRQDNPQASSNLDDCSIPFLRLKEMYDFVDEMKITDEKILHRLYKRTILYYKKVVHNPRYKETLSMQLIMEVFSRINSSIVARRVCLPELVIFLKVRRDIKLFPVFVERYILRFGSRNNNSNN